MSLYTYICHVTRVVDADTIDVVVDVGFGIALGQTDPIRLRLAGIDAPEKRTPEGRLAFDFTRQWVFDRGQEEDGWGPFLLRTVRSRRATDTRDSFGRYLAWIAPLGDTTTIEQRSLNRALVDAGHAVGWTA